MDGEQILLDNARALAVLDSHPGTPDLLPPAHHSHFILSPGTQVGTLTVPHAETGPWKDAQASSQRMDGRLTN